MRRLRFWLARLSPRFWLAKLSPGRGLRKAFAPLAAALRSLWKVGPLQFFQQLGRVLAGAFWGILAWGANLNLRLLLQGLPALVVGAGALVVLTFAVLTPTQEVEAHYWEHAKEAAKVKDYPEALACYERLADLQNDRADIIYELALAAEADGQLDRCRRLMGQLAAVDHQGYAKAHVWQAIRLMAEANQTQQQRQLAETHLLRALEAGIEDKEAAHGLLGELYMTRGRLDQAEPHLLIAVKKKPQVRLRLAMLYASQGNKTRARTEARSAANLYSTVAKADLFAHYARLRWAEAVTFLEDFPGAAAILDEGWTGTGEQFYRPALGRVYATWYDYLGRTGTANQGLRLAVLERGLRCDPKNIALLNRLLDVTRMKTDPLRTPSFVGSTIGWAGTAKGLRLAANVLGGSVAEMGQARATLRRLLAQGDVSAQVHFALGVDAWDRGLAKEARLHWERANKLAPDLPVIANNLAWLLLRTAPNELPKALDLVNLAIEKNPKEVNFRDTRGHIYLKMGKFKEALEDMEAALPYTPNSAELHKSLAEVYARLELPDMAAEHRRLADLEMDKRDTAKKNP